IINQAITQQATLDEALVSTKGRVKIVSCHMRIDPTKTHKEATYQVILDILKLSPCYNAFLISADVHEIYMHHISLRVPNEEFVASPLHDALVTFLKSLGYKGALEYVANMYTLIICINHGEPLVPSSTGVYLGKLTRLTTGKQVSGDVKACLIPDSQRLKFVRKGEDNQVYRISIPDVMLNNDIINLKAYQTYLAITTRVVVLKKARKGMKTPATSKKNVTEKPTSDEYDDEHEERLIRKKPTGVVIRDTPNVSTKKTLDQSKKLKGIEMLSEAAQLKANILKAIKASKRTYRIHQQSRGSSKGAGITPEVPDEPKGKTKGSSEGASITHQSEKADKETADDEEIHMNEEVHSDEEELHADDDAHDDEIVHDDDKKHDDTDEEMNNVENANELKDDQEMAEAETIDSEETEEEKVDSKQAGADQATKDDQAGAQISETQKEKPEVPPSSSSHSLSSNYGNQFLNVSFNTSLVGIIKELVDTEINSLLDVQI
ncbi:hypothetical protein Tco_0449396, partial [Tanacetum coccineum]